MPNLSWFHHGIQHKISFYQDKITVKNDNISNLFKLWNHLENKESIWWQSEENLWNCLINKCITFNIKMLWIIRLHYTFVFWVASKLPLWQVEVVDMPQHQQFVVWVWHGTHTNWWMQKMCTTSSRQGQYRYKGIILGLTSDIIVKW